MRLEDSQAAQPAIASSDWRTLAYEEAERLRDARAREWTISFLRAVDDRLSAVQKLVALALSGAHR